MGQGNPEGSSLQKFLGGSPKNEDFKQQKVSEGRSGDLGSEGKKPRQYPEEKHRLGSPFGGGHLRFLQDPEHRWGTKAAPVGGLEADESTRTGPSPAPFRISSGFFASQRPTMASNSRWLPALLPHLKNPVIAIERLADFLLDAEHLSAAVPHKV